MTSPGTPYREPFRPPPPPRPLLVGLAAGALLFAALAAFTSNKLYEMAKLRGDIPGIAPRMMVVSKLLRRYDSGHGLYSLVDPEEPSLRPREIQLTAAQYHQLRDKQIEVRCEKDGKSCYMRGSVFIDDGNRRFDIFLLTAEICGFLTCLAVMWSRHRAWRRSLPQVAARRS